MGKAFVCAVVSVAILLGLTVGWIASIAVRGLATDVTAWSVAGAVLTAAATIVLVVVTALLWRVTDRSAKAADVSASAALRSVEIATETAKLTEDTAKRQLRAYIVVPGAVLNCDAGGSLRPYVVAGSRAIGTIELVNTGQTPALNVRVKIQIGLRSVPAAAESFGLLPNPPASTTVLGAGRQSRSDAVLPSTILSATISNLASGSEAIFLFGEISYEDIFGESHVTKFRLRNKSGVYDGSMTFSDEGNSIE
ncbi:hypothetical protein CN138_09410 [Sinorhizobium meliloti]|uniref:hypothetical protein n=1 Tax=Rhizobium meliloti TaxID=382 RepID=UPI000B49E029|nr:hypothetical protein [Sinorhizobium meliloti]ASP98520.1 hypothetical protein CDO24_14415 [Sinorhizobium meliloti]MDW9532427.1 hypothetical protein [Sinorhizobium meliloti]MDW9706150.1 hypothetical protein [Sinorhizobium meliloti]MDW9936103.1 hypothetical protein [Sinorhizobium meliloti]MDX0102243.1 hypothetical protein [Sinorhizobium meliloti]